MTIPADAGSANAHTAADTLFDPKPPSLDATGLLAAALAVDLSPKAFRMYAATVVVLRNPGWVRVSDMAAAGGFTEGQARQLVGELVRARLLHKQAIVERNANDVPSVRYRYAVAVSA